MANSRIEYTGVTGTSFSYSGLQLLNGVLVSEQSQLVVTLNGEALTYVSSGPSAGEYTLNKTTRFVTTGDTLVSTDVLLIRRSTERDELHVSFVNNAPISQDSLNLVLQQLLFLGQEAAENAEVARTFGIGNMITGFNNQDYVLVLRAPYSFDVTRITTKTSGGTCTVKLMIDGVDITSSSHGASSTETSTALSALNRVLVGQTLTMVVSSSSLEGTFHLSYDLLCVEV